MRIQCISPPLGKRATGTSFIIPAESSDRLCQGRQRVDITSKVTTGTTRTVPYLFQFVNWPSTRQEHVFRHSFSKLLSSAKSQVDYGGPVDSGRTRILAIYHQRVSSCFFAGTVYIMIIMLQDGKVIDPSILFFESGRNFDREIDCGGAILAPGLIDLQINGGFKVCNEKLRGNKASPNQLLKLAGGLYIRHQGSSIG